MSIDKTIKIHVQGGIVIDVINVPVDWEYVVIDHDIEEEENGKN